MKMKMCFHIRRRVGVLLYLVLIIVFLVLAVVTDLQCCESELLKCLHRYVSVLQKKSLEDLQDMMEIVWGIAITITIFMMEISNQYRYGISLKTVVNYSLMRGTVFVGMAVQKPLKCSFQGLTLFLTLLQPYSSIS